MKKGGLSAGDVAAQYKYKNVLFDVKVDTESNVGFFILLSLFVLKKKITSKIPSWASMYFLCFLADFDNLHSYWDPSINKGYCFLESAWL